MNSQKKTEKEQKSSSKVCPFCGGTTWIQKKQNKSQPVMSRCTCYEMKKVQDIWNQSDIEFKNLDKTLKSFECFNQTTKNMKDTATNYLLRFKNICSSENNSIMFCGTPGSGKTHLLLAVSLNLLKKEKIGVVYMSYVEVITKLKQAAMQPEEYQRLINKYKNAKVLFIDDLFKGKITESDIRIIFEIVNFRINKKLPMMVSTEFNIDRLLEFDAAVASRLYKASKGFYLEINGQENNYRMRS